jgi:hypothetical protein
LATTVPRLRRALASRKTRRGDQDVAIRPVLLERQDDVRDDEVPLCDLGARRGMPRGWLGDELACEGEMGELALGVREGEGRAHALLESLDRVLRELDGHGGHALRDAPTVLVLTALSP